MLKYPAHSAYSSYVDQLNGAVPLIPALGASEAEPEPALIPYPLASGTAGLAVSASTRHIDLRLGVTAESISKYVPEDLPPNQALVRWGNKPSQGEASLLDFWLPTRLVRLAFGASPDEHGTFPMLRTLDPALTDDGILEPVLLKAISEQLHAPRFDVFDVMVHFDTKVSARAEALMLQLMADGVIQQWPTRDTGAAEKPPPITFKYAKALHTVSSSRFAIQLPVGELSHLRHTEWIEQLVSPDASASGTDSPRALFWRAVFCWLHSVHHGEPRWVSAPDGNRFCVELSVGNFPSLRCMYFITDAPTALAHVSSIFDCPPDQLHLQALVIPTVHSWPAQAGATSSGRGGRSSGSGSEKCCWVWTFVPDNAVRLALCSPFAQVQGAQLNYQMFSSYAVSPEFQHTKLTARLPPVSSAPASEDQIVLRSQAIQVPVDVVIGNLVRPGSATEVVAKGIFIARLGRLLGKELLTDSGYDSWADFFGAQLKRHPPNPDPTTKVHGILLTLDLGRGARSRS